MLRINTIAAGVCTVMLGGCFITSTPNPPGTQTSTVRPSPVAVTWNPGDKADHVILSDDQLTASVPADVDSIYDSVRATVGVPSGKWYWEVTLDYLATDYWAAGIGVGTAEFSTEVAPGDMGPGCHLTPTGDLNCGQEHSSLGVTLAQGDVIGIALDLDARKIYYRRNGEWLAGGAPDACSGGFALGAAPEGTLFFPAATVSQGDAFRARFRGPFAHEAPEGYQELDGSDQDKVCSSDSSAVSWNSQDKATNVSINADQLTASVPASADSIFDSVRATRGVKGGKWYWEVTLDYLATDYWAAGVGFGTDVFPLEIAPGDVDYGCNLAPSGSLRCDAGAQNAQTEPLCQGDVIGVALDVERHKVYFRRNGAWLLGSDPVRGFGGVSFGGDPSQPNYFPTVTLSQGDAFRANFAGPFAAAPPAGFFGLQDPEATVCLPGGDVLVASEALIDCDSGPSVSWRPGGGANAELAVIGLYESSRHEGMGTALTGVVYVTVSRPGPTTLYLSAYEKIRWRVTVAPGASVTAIHARGYELPEVTAPDGIPVSVETSYECGYSLPYNGGGCDTGRLLSAAEALGAIHQFDGCYRASVVEL